MTTAAHPIAIVLGTRPEIIKLAPIVHECERRDLPYEMIHTGQHYSDRLDAVFFEQLSLPEPDRHLGVGSASHGKQTGTMIAAIEEAILDVRAKTVLVQGDTNSTLAGAIAAAKLDTSLGHIEAGLRSFDRSMPEELNRILADHAADDLFAPTEQAAVHLHAEGIPATRTVVTGNTIVDALEDNRRRADRESTILREQSLSPSEYLLLTAHRPENVDNPGRFSDLLTGVDRAATHLDCPVMYPRHPRAAETIEQANITVPASIHCIDPVSYFDFLELEANAALVITDSGGVQEETCVLGVPCVTVRKSTERPETIAVGANQLVGTNPDDIHRGAIAMIDRAPDWRNPFGDGDASERILDELDVLATTEVTG